MTQPKRKYKRVEFIPDVFFMEKDEYGNDIKKISRSLPVEYLLIDVPVTTPLQVGLNHGFLVNTIFVVEITRVKQMM